MDKEQEINMLLKKGNQKGLSEEEAKRLFEITVKLLKDETKRLETEIKELELEKAFLREQLS